METPRDCRGEGSGWGTIEGVTLHPLLLVGDHHGVLAEATAAALSSRHHPTLVQSTGWFPGLDAARAAHEHPPELVHAFGADGSAAAGPKVAAGLKVPLVLTLAEAELTPGLSRTLSKAIATAHAVILTNGAAADRLRSLGVTRDLYVIEVPALEDRPAYFGALEVVYGRVLAGTELPLDEAPPAPPGLVQLGGLRKSRPG